MSKLLFIIIFVVSCLSVNGQVQLESFTFRQLLKLAEPLETTNPDSASIIYSYLINEANKQDSFWIKAKSQNYLGFVKMLKGDFDHAHILLSDALDYFEQEKDSVGLTSTLTGIGNVYYYQAQHKEAVKYYQRAATTTKIFDNKASLLANVSSIFTALETPEKAIELLHNIIKQKEKIEQAVILGDCYNNLAVAYGQLDSFSISTRYLMKARDIYLEEDNLYHASLAGLNIIGFMYKSGNYNRLKATKILNNSRAYLNSIHAPRIETMYDKMKCIHEFQTNNYGTAITFCDKALASLEAFPEPREEASIYSVLVDIYEAQTDFENAYISSVKVNELRNEILNDKTSEKILELEEKWQSAEKDAEIKSQNIRISQQKMFGICLTGGLTSLILLSLFIINRLRSRQCLSKQQLQIKEEKIINLEQKQQILAMDFMVQGQEEERKRIAKDLHDGLGALLSSAKLQIKSVEKEIEKFEGFKLFEKVETLLENASQEVRRIAHDMMPDALLNLGLQASIEDMADHINQSETVTMIPQFYLADLILPEKTEIMIYRITQEIVANAIRHANATRIILQMTANDEQFHVTIEDDGIGFDIHDTAFQEGMGIQNIKSRIQYLKGELDLVSKLGKGTSFDIVFPLD